MFSHVSHIYSRAFLNFETMPRQKENETRYIFGPNSFFQILFVMLESTHFKTWEETGEYISKYKQKWERAVRKSGEGDERRENANDE
jgi:hypothetical protein